ncbi:MAG TPA: response regulator [Verrucomicrobiae bacterium]|nr:response regulator [Verrucomicrobiae bacterium]
MSNRPLSDSNTQASTLRILHLEDDLRDAEQVAWTLDAAAIPCEITRVEDEQTFAAALGRGGFDLILADSGVRGFSGLTALKMAREAHHSAPFVFLTGHDGPEPRAKAKRLGAADFLSKDHRIQLLFLVQGLYQRKQRD